MANMMTTEAEVAPRHVLEVSRWSEWCLENTCSLLRHKFPSTAVWTVRPCRMLRRLYSSFHHFVASSITGVPSYSTNNGALLHIHSLLSDVLRKERDRGALELAVSDALALPLVIVGFSKGCVVLNQIVHELTNVFSDHSLSDISSAQPQASSVTASSCCHDNLKATPTATSDSSEKEVKQHLSEPLPLEPDELKLLQEIVSRIRSFYWLDSGHSGTEGAWVTDKELLRCLSSLQIPVHVDVTPQQVRDPDRVWIGEEEAEFVDTLRQFGASIVETVHFENEEKCLENHFRVLREFQP